MEVVIDRAKFKDSQGRFITQKLFLEYAYDTDFAIYTFDDEHKEYKGVIYFSLKKLYIEEGDVTEYSFAKKYLSGWKHWKKLQGNKQILAHIKEWREELMLSIKSDAIKSIIDCSMNDTGFQASKWLAENGWEKRGPGRPSKLEKEEHLAQQDRISQDFKDDFDRLNFMRVQ